MKYLMMYENYKIRHSAKGYTKKEAESAIKSNLKILNKNFSFDSDTAAGTSELPIRAFWHIENRMNDFGGEESNLEISFYENHQNTFSFTISDDRKWTSRNIKYQLSKLLPFGGVDLTSPQIGLDFDTLKESYDYITSLGLKLPRKIELLFLGLSEKEISEMQEIYSFMSTKNESVIYKHRFIEALEEFSEEIKNRNQKKYNLTLSIISYIDTEGLQLFTLV